MGYVKTPFPSLSSSSSKIAYLETPTRGVCFGKDDLFLEKGQSPNMINLEAFSGILKTRQGQCSVFGKDPLCTAFHSITKQPFYEATILHNGTNLYKLTSKNNQPELIFSQMPDKNSVFVEFKAKLYIYCDLRIYSVDKEFKVVEEMPYAPLLFDKISHSAENTKINTDNKLNLAAPALTITYKEANLGYYDYSFPVEADIQRPVTVKSNDEIIDASTYEVTNEKITFKKHFIVDSKNSLSVSYFAKNPEDIKFEDKFSKCTLTTTFGGTINSGTRIFMTGNKDLPGYYFKSDLLDPLRFEQDNYDIIGSGSENISALIRQYGNLIIFTDRSVFKMNYDFVDGETIFSVKELNHYIGCDMPRSVEIIDNRIVFANSNKGIFIIDSSEDFGEQNIKPISGNINHGLSVCLLNQDKEALTNAFSIDYNRKYYLCVGTNVYVWDYDAKCYSSSYDYSTSQQKLIWYVFTDIKASEFFELDNMLYTAGTGIDSGFAIFRYDGKDFDKPIQYSFSSAKTYLSYPHMFKSIYELSLDCESQNDVEISLFDDYNEFFSITVRSSDSKTKRIKIPSRKTALFAFSVKGQGNIKFSNIYTKYKLLNKERK